LNDLEKQSLNQVKAEYLHLSQYQILEPVVKMVVLSPLLRLAGFYQPPFYIASEEEVEIVSEDEGTIIRGRIDILVFQPLFWVLVVEAKRADYSLEVAIPSRSNCKTPASFGFQLALQYLNIQPTFSAKGMQVGKTLFKRLEADSGGYQNIDPGGFQILLNYRSQNNVAQQVSISDVLGDRIKPSWVKNRIILIGSTAPSSQDIRNTPYSNGKRDDSGKMPGVTIYAHMVSQILDAASGKRPLFWFLPEWGEILLFVGWATVGSSLAWYIGRPVILVFAGTLTLGMLFGISFGIFLLGGWIPVMTPAIAFLINGGSVAAYQIIREQQIKQLVKWVEQKNKASGSALDFSDMSITVTNSISQLTNSKESSLAAIKELLSQLQTTVESDDNLQPDDKAEALQQLAYLVAYASNSTNKEMKITAKRAIRIMVGMMADLPHAKTFVSTVSPLLPEISKLLHLK
jgi:hypothetical protein